MACSDLYIYITWLVVGTRWLRVEVKRRLWCIHNKEILS